MKKLLSLLLALTMIFSLTACVNDPNDDEDRDENEDEVSDYPIVCEFEIDDSAMTLTIEEKKKVTMSWIMETMTEDDLYYMDIDVNDVEVEFAVTVKGTYKEKRGTYTLSWSDVYGTMTFSGKDAKAAKAGMLDYFESFADDEEYEKYEQMIDGKEADITDEMDFSETKMEATLDGDKLEALVIYESDSDDIDVAYTFHSNGRVKTESLYSDGEVYCKYTYSKNGDLTDTWYADEDTDQPITTDDGTVHNTYETVWINGYGYKKATDMTDEQITLTYLHFDQDETVEYLAERFMELYPNIKVEVIYENVATYNHTLNALIATGDAPDIIMYSDCDFALSNALLADISGYWNTDEETRSVASTINTAGLGCYSTSGRFGVPVKFYPGVIFVDQGVLDNLNLEKPGQDWTWSEMIDLIKKATLLQSPDGMAYYGLGYYNRLDAYYGIAAGQEYVGEFGFNGKTFDPGVWAIGEQEFSDLKLSSYVAPQSETPEMEMWMGDWEGWYGASGHVAVLTDAFWTFQSTWNNPNWYSDYDSDIVPYVIPAVSSADASADHHSIATIDYGGVSIVCQYPREAYELLKFMSFGIDGWMTRIELYNDESITNSSGVALKYDVMPAPITTDEEVWDAYIDMYCAGMDAEHVEHWRNYFASCLQPISYGWTSIAGYWDFCDEYFNSISAGGHTGVHNIVDAGIMQAADLVPEATRKANYYHAKAMLNYFGPDSVYAWIGVNVLTGEQIAVYEQILADNS